MLRFHCTVGQERLGRALFRSEQAAQLLAVDARVAQNAGERSALEFAMKRNDERNGAVSMLEANVAAALAHRKASRACRVRR